MKRIPLITYITLLLVTIGTMTGCNEPVTEFGFNGSISGTILDNSGKIVPGDITSSGYTVHALGELDQVSMIMRVKGDGTFANHKLYPQVYQVWVEGPFFDSPEVTVDLSGNKAVVQDFEVTPYLSLEKPTVEGAITSSEVKVNYSVTGHDGHTPDLIEVYCSTVPYPNSSTGSGPMYHTVTAEVTEDHQGIATLTGLKAGTEYFIRAGARSTEASIMNFSEQIIITTP